MKFNLRNTAFAGVALTLALVSNVVSAFEEGDWLVRAGVSNVDPKSNNHEIVSVESAASATINFSYMLTDTWSVELLAAYPFKHDIELLDGTKVGSTKQLPPTLSLQYHFMPTSKFQPYVGAGLNYTVFFSEKTGGPLEGTDLDLDASWGLAGEVGVDILINDNWFFNLDARYISIETKAKLDGAGLGKVQIDPWVYGAHIGFRF